MAGSCQRMLCDDITFDNNRVPACRDESIDSMAAIYRQMEALTGGQWAAVSAVWCRVTYSSKRISPAVAASFTSQLGLHSEMSAAHVHMELPARLPHTMC